MVMVLAVPNKESAEKKIATGTVEKRENMEVGTGSTDGTR